MVSTDTEVNEQRVDDSLSDDPWAPVGKGAHATDDAQIEQNKRYIRQGDPYDLIRFDA